MAPSGTFRGKTIKPAPQETKDHTVAQQIPKRFIASTLETALPENDTQGSVLTLAELQERRATEREQRLIHDRSHTPRSSDESHTDVDQSDSHSAQLSSRKRKRNGIGKSKLSFGYNEDEEDIPTRNKKHAEHTSRSTNRSCDGELEIEHPRPTSLGPNALVNYAPKLLSQVTNLKATERKAAEEEILREKQEMVKRDVIVIPFVYFEGKNVHGGRIKLRKGDKVDELLDKARKMGAQLEDDKARKQAAQSPADSALSKPQKNWARVRLDDMMLVRSGIIIPHYYDFQYFITNHVQGFKGTLFDFSAEPSGASLSRDSDAELEGAAHDPNITQVVEKSWYEQNKHIFPASVWEHFDPKKDYSKLIRRDLHGNTYHF